LGGSYEGEKIDNEKINFLATLPSLDQIRAKLLGLLNAPAQKIAYITQAPGGQLARLINARSEQLEKSNQV
jgi:large subunit ribosomal protein L10